jgi:hypothetical protein
MIVRPTKHRTAEMAPAERGTPSGIFPLPAGAVSPTLIKQAGISPWPHDRRASLQRRNWGLALLIALLAAGTIAEHPSMAQLCGNLAGVPCGP